MYPDDVETRIGSVKHIEELTILGMDDPRGGERIACVAVCKEDSTLDPDARRARAQKSLDAALKQLPAAMRPAHVTLLDSPLPRTATRKVKRREVRRLIERVGPLSELVDTLRAVNEAALHRARTESALRRIALEAACLRGTFDDKNIKRLAREATQ